jgi:hypothetical protein
MRTESHRETEKSASQSPSVNPSGRMDKHAIAVNTHLDALFLFRKRK